MKRVSRLQVLWIILLVVITGSVVGCDALNGDDGDEASVTATPSMTLPPPTITPTPSPTPRPRPVLDVTPGDLLGQGIVMHAVWSPDNRTMAVATTGGIWLFNLVQDTLPPRLAADQPSVVRHIAFNPAGTLLAAGSEDGAIRVRDVASLEIVATYEAHDAPVNAVAFSPDGTLLVSASDDGTVQTHAVETGELRFTLEGAEAPYTALAFSPDGLLLAAASADNNIWLWTMPDGNAYFVLQGHTDVVNDVAFSLDGQFVGSVSDDRTVRFWEVETGNPHATLEDHQRPVRAIAFNNENLAVSAGDDPEALVWDVESGERHEDLAFDEPVMVPVTLTGITAPVTDLAFDAEGTRVLGTGIATESTGGRIYLWNLLAPEPLRIWDDFSAPLSQVAYSPDGAVVAYLDMEGGLGLYVIESGTTLLEIESPAADTSAEDTPPRILSLAYTPEGLLVGLSDGQLQWRNTVDGGVERSVAAHDDPVIDVVVNPANTLAITLSGAGEAQLRAYENGLANLPRSGDSLQSEAGPFTVFAFNADGSLLAAGDSEGVVTLWAVEGDALEELATFEGHDSGVTGLAFREQGGQRLVSVGADGQVRLWHILRQESDGVLFEDDEQVFHAVAISPDGDVLAVARDDGTIMLFDIGPGGDRENPIRLDSHTAAVMDLAFYPGEGRRLVSVSGDGTVRFWHIERMLQ